MTASNVAAAFCLPNEFNKDLFRNLLWLQQQQQVQQKNIKLDETK